MFYRDRIPPPSSRPRWYAAPTPFNVSAQTPKRLQAAASLTLLWVFISYVYRLHQYMKRGMSPCFLCFSNERSFVLACLSVANAR